ncbi:hypothetical protein LHL18_16775 [Rheinheimera aquimaris]|nr:hypothetical protein [Rheinheimera aquimaris]MCB5215130.1 hypothetical protein [Rheinheimera aquimaris]
MRNAFLASLLLTMLSVHAEQTLSPLYNDNHIQQTQEYITSAITLHKDGQVDEGALAYANHVAHGDKVTVVSSQHGIAIYSQVGDFYQLVREIKNSELGLQQYDSVAKMYVSGTDNWFLYQVNDKVFTVVLDQEFNPSLETRSELTVGYGQQLVINNGTAVSRNGNIVTTFTINETTGAMAVLSSMQLSTYPDYIAFANGILLAAQSSWQNDKKNLMVYKLDNNGQWQFITDHSMAVNGSGSQYVRYVALSPDGQRVMYGSREQDYILQLDTVAGQLTEVANGNYLNSYYSQVHFIDNQYVLVLASNQVSLFNSQQQTQFASMNLDSFSSSVKDYALSLANGAKLTVLGQSGLLQLFANSLTVNITVTPGEQEIYFDFADASNVMILNDKYLLHRSSTHYRLYKLEQQGMPQLTQISTPEQLLGEQNYYYPRKLLHISNNLYALFQGDRYSVIQLDEANDKLLQFSSGTLYDRNGNSLYTADNNIVSVGSALVIANNDTLNLLTLGADYHFSFADAAVNGASGVSGIAQIQMLVAAGEFIYAVDQYNSVMSKFIVSQNRLQQQEQYRSYDFPQLSGYYIRDDLLTLRSDNYLLNYRMADNGSLTLLSTQYLSGNIARWAPVGERFAAVQGWQDLRVLEQDSVTGLWSEQLELNNQQLQQQFQLASPALLALGRTIGVYDGQNKKLVRLAHNSAPYATSAAKLKLKLNQGVPFQLELSSVIADEEDSALSFNLLTATADFSLSDNQLKFNGQGVTDSGYIDITAADPSDLVAKFTFEYTMNLAPVVKAQVPTLNVVQGEAMHIELAQYFADPEGQALQFRLSSALLGLTVSNNGLLTGKLNTNGELRVSVTVSDAAGASADHVITLAVAAKPEESSGGSMHWLLLSLLALIALNRSNKRRS